MDEFKWLFIGLALIIIGAFSGMAYQDHLRHECRMEVIKALIDPSKIETICK